LPEVHEAVANVAVAAYWIIGNNCQSWANAVRNEYRRLERLKKLGNCE
jgi:hypothetical protein